MLIVLVIVVVLPALSTALKSIVYTPSTASDVLDCQAPPFTDTCALAKPDMASDPLAEIATGVVLNHPFDPVDEGITEVTAGGVVSRFHFFDPVSLLPLSDAVTL
jgi:hypothetical protein